MIQFNLLPSVKLEYVKARRNQRLTLMVAGLVAAVSLLGLVLLFVNVQLQIKHSRDLSNDIKTESTKLEGTENISSMLTIQNQLNSLSTLHTNKPEAARVFDYIKETTPSGVAVSNVEVDFETAVVLVKGRASSISLVNTYVDTLKFTTFKPADSDTPANAFKEVVLGSIVTDPADNSVAYELRFGYEPAIFSNATKVPLTVPNKATTRSGLDKPDSVFQAQEDE